MPRPPEGLNEWWRSSDRGIRYALLSQQEGVINKRIEYWKEFIEPRFKGQEYADILGDTWAGAWLWITRCTYEDIIVLLRLDQYERRLREVERLNHARGLAWKYGYCPYYLSIADVMTEPVCSCPGC
jgi:hypothetical protein